MSGPHKVWGTRTDSTGTGYYRGDNGKYYYGNPRNGFLTETIDEQNKRRAREEANKKADAPQPVQQNTSGGRSGGGSYGLDLFEFIASTAGLATVLCVCFLFGLFTALLVSWPRYISVLVDCYSQGIIDLPLIMVTGSVLFQTVYFLVCAASSIKSKVRKSARYLITCTIVTTVLHSVFNLLGGALDIGSLLINALNGLSLACIPAFLLAFVDHIATKKIRGDKEWFITKVSRVFCRFFPFHSVGVLIVGIGTFPVAGMTQLVGGLGSFKDAAIFTMGGLLILMGILGRKKR